MNFYAFFPHLRKKLTEKQTKNRKIPDTLFCVEDIQGCSDELRKKCGNFVLKNLKT